MNDINAKKNHTILKKQKEEIFLESKKSKEMYKNFYHPERVMMAKLCHWNSMILNRKKRDYEINILIDSKKRGKYDANIDTFKLKVFWQINNF